MQNDMKFEPHEQKTYAMRSSSIRKRLIIALTCILVSSFLLLSIINYKATRDNVRAELLSALPLTGETIYSEIHGALMRPMLISSLMAHDAFLVDWVASGERDLGKITRFLETIKNKYGFFSSFFVSNITHNYYHSNGILKRISKNDAHDVWYYSFVDSDKDYILDVDTNQAADDALTVFLNFRVQNSQGKLLGVAGVGLKMDIVSKFLKKADKKYSRLVYLVDPEGIIQAHPNLGSVQDKDIYNSPGLGELADSMLQAAKSPSNYEYETDGKQMLVSVRYMPDLGWFLFAEQDVDRVLAAARHNFARTIAVGLGVSIIVIISSLLTVNHFQLRLERMARTDELTGLANRREFESGFDLAVARYKRQKKPFSLILLDIDSFKQINDSLGHLAGDGVIVEVARTIRASARGTDLPARWGGDEFVILMEGDLQDARSTAERIREKLRTQTMPGELQELRVTISCGLAQYEEDDSLDATITRADNALYAAKKHGRDQVADF